jgi:hypothetical protein
LNGTHRKANGITSLLIKIEGTESKGVTEVLNLHQCSLEHQLSRNAFVPVYANYVDFYEK